MHRHFKLYKLIIIVIKQGINHLRKYFKLASFELKRRLLLKIFYERNFVQFIITSGYDKVDTVGEIYQDAHAYKNRD